VRDIAAAVVAAARAPEPGPLLNIGSGTAVDVRMLVEALIATSGVPAVVEEVAPVESVRGAGIEWQQVDITAARRSLHWSPRRPLTVSLRDLWAAVR
jgi:nucleoside-diphosphate-sugar epimerase